MRSSLKKRMMDGKNIIKNGDGVIGNKLSTVLDYLFLCLYDEKNYIKNIRNIADEC